MIVDFAKRISSTVAIPVDIISGVFSLPRASRYGIFVISPDGILMGDIFMLANNSILIKSKGEDIKIIFLLGIVFQKSFPFFFGEKGK